MSECIHEDAVKWNPYNKVVQCHRCGWIFVPEENKSSLAARDEALAIAREALIDSELSFHFLHGYLCDKPKSKDFGWDKVFKIIQEAIAKIEAVMKKENDNETNIRR